jgi:protein-tyrosine phosphatase
LGNICRSPLAEAAFRAEAARIGLEAETDSAGTSGWHVGEPPDPRSISTARRHGIDISGQRGRKVRPDDFHRFTHIVALDDGNLAVLRRMRPADATAQLSLLLDHVAGRKGESVADPYNGDESAFEITWADAMQGARALATKIAEGA